MSKAVCDIGPRFVVLLLTLLLTLASNPLVSQSKTLTFKKAALHTVIDKVETQIDYVFNYDPDLLRDYNFTGKVNTTEVESLLAKVFYQSPYTYEIDESTILIYKPEPQFYRICGAVKDALTQEPLIAASIVASGVLTGSQSDVNGNFDFNLTSDKNQRINISYLGYETITFMVQDLKGAECPTYTLQTDEGLMSKEIVITDYILDGIKSGNTYGGFELDYDRLSKNHSNVEHDILKTAQLLPGINSIDDSATHIQIRGSSPDQNLILWEGVPVYNAGHIFGMISAINPFSVNKVTIYKGAHNPKYDSRVGGIIDISLTDEIDSTFHGSVGTTLTELHANLEIPIVKNRVSLILSGRQSFNGIYASPPLLSYTEKVFQLSFLDDQREIVELGILEVDQVLSYSDWNAKLIYQATDNLDFNLGIYRNQQDFNYTFSFMDDPDYNRDIIGLNTDVIKGNMNYKMSKQWSSSLSAHYSLYGNSYVQQEFEGGVITSPFEQTNGVEDQSIIFANNIAPLTHLNLGFGYEYNAKTVTLDLADDSFVLPDFGPEKILERASLHNPFVSATYNPGKLTVDAGLRAAYYEERSGWVYSPRASVQYAINPSWTLKADAGIYHQFITQLNDYEDRQITRDNPLWILNSSEDGLSQKAYKIAGGLVYQKSGWLIDVEGYYNLTEGLSSLSPILKTLPNLLVFARGTATTTGVDLLVKKQWSGFNTWLNYSFGKAQQDFPELLDKPFYSPNDIRHNLTFVNSYKYRKFQFSFNTNYHSGLPYSEPRSVFVEGETMAPFTYELKYDDLNDYRLDPYLRFDLSVNYRSSFKRWSNLNSEISVSCINLLNRTNINARGHYHNFDNEMPMPDIIFEDKFLVGRTPLLMIRLYW